MVHGHFLEMNGVLIQMLPERRDTTIMALLTLTLLRYIGAADVLLRRMAQAQPTHNVLATYTSIYPYDVFLK